MCLQIRNFSQPDGGTGQVEGCDRAAAVELILHKLQDATVHVRVLFREAAHLLAAHL